MEQRITDRIKLRPSYRVDKQFLVCLKDIFISHNSEARIKIETWGGKIKYSFSNVEEFLEKSEGLTEQIEHMKIVASFPVRGRYLENEVTIDLSNMHSANAGGTVDFDFYDPNDYYILKNKIETLIKNYKLPYSLWSEFAICPFVGIVVFAIICIYTYVEKIIFPDIVQVFVWLMLFSSVLVPSFASARKFKRFLFPLYEFDFGVNTITYKRAEAVRNTLGVGVLLAFLVGVAVNVFSNFLLPQ